MEKRKHLCTVGAVQIGAATMADSVKVLQKMRVFNVMLKWSPRLESISPTSSTILPVRKQICFLMNAVKTGDQEEIKRQI